MQTRSIADHNNYIICQQEVFLTQSGSRPITVETTPKQKGLLVKLYKARSNIDQLKAIQKQALPSAGQDIAKRSRLIAKWQDCSAELPGPINHRAAVLEMYGLHLYLHARS